MLGTVGGVTVGTHGGTDLLSQISLGSARPALNTTSANVAHGVYFRLCLSGWATDRAPAGTNAARYQHHPRRQAHCRRQTNCRRHAAVVRRRRQSDSRFDRTAAYRESPMPMGFYQFTGLDAGTYIVRELQPSGYIDGIDTPGSTGGLAINHDTPASSIPHLPFDPTFDVIVSIPLGMNSRLARTISAKWSRSRCRFCRRRELRRS